VIPILQDFGLHWNDGGLAALQSSWKLVADFCFSAFSCYNGAVAVQDLMEAGSADGGRSDRINRAFAHFAVNSFLTAKHAKTSTRVAVVGFSIARSC